MVKSRRAASASQSRPKVTTACRPSVSMSARKVVTSNERPLRTAVTVPCSMPVGTALNPAASTRRIVSSGSVVVAMSMSETGSPSSVLRTAPPATRASSPPSDSALSSRCRSPSASQSEPATETGSLIGRAARRSSARCRP